MIGFAGWSGAGKTTLLTQLIPILRAAGVRVSVIKHAHHQFDLDTPGKDSFRLRKAGAVQTLIASDTRRVLVTELEQPRDPALVELIEEFDHAMTDLILVEGFRDQPFPKLEVYRPSLGRPPLYPADPSVIAVASDGRPDTVLPILDLNNPTAVAEFILARLA